MDRLTAACVRAGVPRAQLDLWLHHLGLSPPERMSARERAALCLIVEAFVIPDPVPGHRKESRPHVV